MRKKKKSNKYQDVELNITPLIDILSMLTTFLLMSASMGALGILNVQIPFFTNAPSSDSESKSKDVKKLDIKIEINYNDLILKTQWTEGPVDKKEYKFKNNSLGIKKLHSKLINIKKTSKKTNKVLVFIEDKININQMVQVLDSIKLVWPKDHNKIKIKNDNVTGKDTFLFEQVVLGNVI